jgi:outer membrane protein W
MRKVLVLSLVAASAFAGKNVAVAPVAPVPVENVAPAAIASHSISLKAGTLGVGVDIEHMFNKKHALRFNINGLKVSKTKTLDDVKYDLDLKLLNAGLLYDYHPWEGSFRLSVGVYYNGNKIEGSATPASNVTIGNTTYTPAQVGRIDAKIDFKKIAPYIGIGWSSTETKGWHFTADIGVMYSGTPKVSLKTTSNLVSQADIEQEIQNVKDDIKKYRWWPVLTIGIQKKF